jgi:PAS domain-containing protein
MPHAVEPGDGPGVDWAHWIVARRSAIEQALTAGAGGAVPAASSAESEALRRFRSFAAMALHRGDDVAPAVDGVRVDAARAAPVLERWCEAAAEVAGERGSELRGLLGPLAERFGAALTGAGMARAARRPPRTRRRAVAGAIDRIADAFLAIDLDAACVVDANPAATVLLRTPRETLLGSDARRFVHEDTRAEWSEELDELVESDQPRRFRTTLVDALGRPRAVEAHATRHLPARERVLALLVLRSV